MAAVTAEQVEREATEADIVARLDHSRVEDALKAVRQIARDAAELVARVQVSGETALAQPEFAKAFFSLLDTAAATERTVHNAGGRRKPVKVRWTGSGTWTRDSYERRAREINSGQLSSISYYHQYVIGRKDNKIGQTHGYPIPGTAKVAANGQSITLELYPGESC